jgi:hypothetical protein
MSEPKHDMSGMEHTHDSDHGMSGDAGSTAHDMNSGHAH